MTLGTMVRHEMVIQATCSKYSDREVGASVRAMIRTNGHAAVHWQYLREVKTLASSFTRSVVDVLSHSLSPPPLTQPVPILSSLIAIQILGAACGACHTSLTGLERRGR